VLGWTSRLQHNPPTDALAHDVKDEARQGTRVSQDSVPLGNKAYATKGSLHPLHSHAEREQHAQGILEKGAVREIS
jgi:hypothetical protein